MSHVNLFAFATKFFVLGICVAIDVLWWRDALMGPPAKRRALLAVAVVFLLPVLVTVWDMVFFPFG